MNNYNVIKLLPLLALLFLIGCNKESNSLKDPLNGHNGIIYDMDQRDLEEMGFVCKPVEDESKETVCSHMDMTGMAFGFPTKNYLVRFNQNNEMELIHVDFDSNNRLSDYLKIESKIEFFYPKKLTQQVVGAAGYAMFSDWLAKNKSGVRLLYVKGSPPIVDGELSISFFSPKANFSDLHK